MIRTALLAGCLLAAASPALAGPTCSPSDDSVRILASASPNNVHRDYRGANQIGTGWSLQVERTTHDASGTEYYIGDLYSPTGELAKRKVFALEREWDCGP